MLEIIRANYSANGGSKVMNYYFKFNYMLLIMYFELHSGNTQLKKWN